jgi:hypothetical protein
MTLYGSQFNDQCCFQRLLSVTREQVASKDAAIDAVSVQPLCTREAGGGGGGWWGQERGNSGSDSGSDSDDTAGQYQ